MRKNVGPKVKIIESRRAEWLHASLKVKQVSNKYSVLIVYDAPRESWTLSRDLDSRTAALNKLDEYFLRFQRAKEQGFKAPMVGGDYDTGRSETTEQTAGTKANPDVDGAGRWRLNKPAKRSTKRKIRL